VGPDLGAGVEVWTLKDGEPLLGHANGEAVIVVSRGEALCAVGASCSHYGGPLAEGLVVGDTVRCPWHHACFSLETGEAIGGPALSPVPAYEIVGKGSRVSVGARREPPRRELPTAEVPASVVGRSEGAISQDWRRSVGRGRPSFGLAGSVH